MVLAVQVLPLCAEDLNLWPFWLDIPAEKTGRVETQRSLGPFFQLKHEQEKEILSLRPFWTQFSRPEPWESSQHLLYPLANRYEQGPATTFHAMNLLQYRYNVETGRQFFQAFPFLFSLQSPRSEKSYFAFWPFGGVLKNRFWRDEIRFAAWPLWVRTKKGDETWHHFPYPFLRKLSGPRSEGFGIWPLYGQARRENDYLHRWALWPLVYHYKDDLDAPEPFVRFGVLPFYHRETAAGLRSETWLWPFFGYTRENSPRKQYSENRYFWPFLVQGRGEEKYVNRWLPLFAEERRPGRQKEWWLWPLWKTEEFTGMGPRRERDTLLYFVYRDERQFLGGETTARLTTLWPFFGRWTNGNGRTQVQALDPLSVFFPGNEKVKENWSPLFALYRYDRRGGSRRHSLLWDLLVWERTRNGARLQAGPLFEWDGSAPEGQRWEILEGLIEFDNTEDGGGLRFLWNLL